MAFAFARSARHSIHIRKASVGRAEVLLAITTAERGFSIANPRQAHLPQENAAVADLVEFGQLAGLASTETTRLDRVIRASCARTIAGAPPIYR
jgi:hypothetical protein